MSGKTNPDWLDWLKGESPLLPTSEIEYIAEVRSRIIQEAKSSETYHDDRLSECKLSILKDDFKQVVDYLRKSTKFIENFLVLYPGWCTVRDASIRQLRCIVNTIERDNKNYIANKKAAHLTALVGGIICLATGGWSRLLGTGLMALGAGAATSKENSQEEVLSSLHGEIEKAKEIIEEEHKEFSRKVWHWIGDGIYVEKDLNNINSIDADEKWKKAARALQNLLQNHDETQYGKSIMNSKIKSIMAELPPNLAKAVADAVGILIATTMLLKEYHHVFGTILVAKQFYGVRDLEAIKVQRMSLQRNLSIGIFMVEHVISLLSSNEDLKFVSEEALEIKKVTDKLEKEAKMFDGLYNKLVDHIH